MLRSPKPGRTGYSPLLWYFLGSLWRATQLRSSATSRSQSCPAEGCLREHSLKSPCALTSLPLGSPTHGWPGGGLVLRVKNLSKETQRQRQRERNPGHREERVAMSCNKRKWWRTNPGSNFLSLNSCMVLVRSLNFTEA